MEYFTENSIEKYFDLMQKNYDSNIGICVSQSNEINPRSQIPVIVLTGGIILFFN